MQKDLLRYSMQLAMLKQLLNRGMLTDKEFAAIKATLMQDYKIISNPYS